MAGPPSTPVATSLYMPRLGRRSSEPMKRTFFLVWERTRRGEEHRSSEGRRSMVMAVRAACNWAQLSSV